MKTPALILALALLPQLHATIDRPDDYVYSAQNKVLGTKIYEPDGTWKGLYNANPDPQGEPWIIGALPPLTSEQLAALERLPIFTLSPEQRQALAAPQALPATVINSNHQAFRPIFTQNGGSCGQASGIGYHFTYERNLALGRAASSPANICAYGFTWNFMNGGDRNIGSWPDWGYSVTQDMGAASVADFNGSDSGGSESAWTSGYQRYFNALDAKVTRVVKFNPRDIQSLKNWLFDKGKGTGTQGGLVTFACSFNTIKQTVSIPDGPFMGQQVATVIQPDPPDHAMTLVGYSDEITVNGKTGAFLVANSHGTGFKNNGFVWVMCDGFNPHSNQVLGIEVAPHSPELLVKSTFTSSLRNTIVASVGYAAAVGAAAPAEKRTNKWGFNLDGGALPMRGAGQSPTLEFGMDATMFISKLPSRKGTVFLEATGLGSVNALSVMYHGTNPPTEFVYEGSLGPINGTQNLGIDVDLNLPSLRVTSPNGTEVLRRGE
ncbi:MAG: hypothetical protein Q8O00_15760, partial [Holophaga sp.]|nr:hypothetical protein [Holophaga sp.]